MPRQFPRDCPVIRTENPPSFNPHTRKRTVPPPEESRHALLNARKEFRTFLQDYGLISLAGSESDAIDWLENEIVQFADSISKRQRFLRMLREARAQLEREERKWKALGSG